MRIDNNSKSKQHNNYYNYGEERSNNCGISEQPEYMEQDSGSIFHDN